MFKLNMLDKISFVMVILGALNWGTIGLFNINIFFTLLGGLSVLLRLLYIIILISAVDLIYLLVKANIFKIKVK